MVACGSPQAVKNHRQLPVVNPQAVKNHRQLPVVNPQAMDSQGPQATNPSPQAMESRNLDLSR